MFPSASSDTQLIVSLGRLSPVSFCFRTRSILVSEIRKYSIGSCFIHSHIRGRFEKSPDKPFTNLFGKLQSRFNSYHILTFTISGEDCELDQGAEQVTLF